VRSDTPGATLKLKLQEFRKDTGALVGAASSVITLTTAWQQISVRYAPLAPGASTLDYKAYVANANSPEQAARYAEYLTFLDGAPEWHDGEVVSSFPA